jgi:tripartite-type tricarboxylate transporter receptor subunit TctC
MYWIDERMEGNDTCRAGQLRALAVVTATRSDALPHIPAMAEFVPGYEASSLYGVGAPKATPAEIIDKLNKEINAAPADPKNKARLAKWVAKRSRSRPLTLAGSSPTIRRSGATSFGPSTSRRSEADPLSIFCKAR